MAITVCVGRPGQGKSVWLVGEILRYLRKGYCVYTNVSISDIRLAERYKDKLFFIESLDDCLELREGKIILDEVQTYLNSRHWDKLDVQFQLLLQQHRKRGLDIIGATQSIKRADVVFRELVQYFYRIQKVFVIRVPKYNDVFGFFLLREYDPDDIESTTPTKSVKSIGWPRPYFVDPGTFRVYDTTQEYHPPIREGQRYIEEYVLTLDKPELKKQMVRKEKVKEPPLT